VKRILLLLSLLWVLELSGQTPTPSAYPIQVRVTDSKMVLLGTESAFRQNIGVLIDGKKYRLQSIGMPNSLLVLGDYKARIVKDDHGKGAYDRWQVYEFQFPDHKTRQYLVVEQTD
jgi:hypothetical protein